MASGIKQSGAFQRRYFFAQNRAPELPVVRRPRPKAFTDKNLPLTAPSPNTADYHLSNHQIRIRFEQKFEVKTLIPMDERQDERIERGQDELRRKLSSGPGRLWAGLFAILVGGVLLLDQLGFPLPDWLFSWHILLIAIGLFIGLRHNFRGGAWLILILVGSCFLIQDFYPKTELRRFIGPCVLIFIGFIIMFRPKRAWRNNEWKHEWKREWKDQMHRKWHNEWERQYWHRRWGHNQPNENQPNQQQPYQNQQGQNPQTPNQPDPETGPTAQAANGGQTGQSHTGQSQTGQGQGQNYSSEDYIDTTSIFGGVHKKVVSKNFRGGDVVTFLGGSEIDLSQSEIFGTARLDVTQVMGGTKIIVPAHWEVRSEVTAIFAGFEDKRQQPATINPDKVLIIDGTSIFGGIELKNY